MDFADKWEAFDWMYRKQLGRRNLTEELVIYCRGKMYEARKNTISNAYGNNQYAKEVGGESLHQAKPHNKTRFQLAEELGVKEGAIKEAYEFSRGVDKVKEVSPEASEKILNGTSGLSTLMIFYAKSGGFMQDSMHNYRVEHFTKLKNVEF